MSLAALGWLRDIGASFVHLDYDGEPLAVSEVRGNDDPRLRRAQALAWGTETGRRITRDLLTTKLEGQRRLAAELGGPEDVAVIDGAIRGLEGAWTPAEAMRWEADAANRYWSVLAPTPMTFVRADARRVPPSWLTIGARTSPLTSSPRKAVTPAQAMVNVLYGLAEALSRQACAVVGLDPGLGVLHADLKARDSMALDLLETCRPSIDAYVVGLLQSRPFAAREFREDRHGQVWVHPTLAKSLAETAPVWARELGAAAERVAKVVARAPGSRVDHVPTPVTEDNRSAGRAAVRRRVRTGQSSAPPTPAALCGACGEPVGPDRTYCDECGPRENRRAVGLAAEAASERLASLRTARIRSRPRRGGGA